MTKVEKLILDPDPDKNQEKVTDDFDLDQKCKYCRIDYTNCNVQSKTEVFHLDSPEQGFPNLEGSRQLVQDATWFEQGCGVMEEQGHLSFPYPVQPQFVRVVREEVINKLMNC